MGRSRCLIGLGILAGIYLEALPFRWLHVEVLEKTKAKLFGTDTTNKQPVPASLPPACTVIVPAYKATPFLDRLMDSLWQQTYPNLHLIVSIEPSEDADETERILHRHGRRMNDTTNHATTNWRSLAIYRQPNQLHYFANMNFLIDKVTTPYYSYMQVDDTVPPDYYRALIMDCLEARPLAANCFPAHMKKIASGNYSHFKINTFNKAVSGPQNERAERALTFIGQLNKGVVRRPLLPGQELTYPRLFQNHPACDQAMVVKHAIAGELWPVDVTYTKYLHPDSVSHFSAEPSRDTDYKSSYVDLWVQKYNMVHSYVARSDDVAEKTATKLKTHVEQYWRHKYANNSWPRHMVQAAVDEFYERIRQPHRVAILGAGIQGCLMALMFRKHGFDVTLIDKANDIMARTSTTGEGRIHMGLEYANDPSMSTATYMIQSAMRFATYTEYLVGRPLDWSRLRSERLKCLLPHTSHVTPEEFEAYGRRLDRLYEDILAEDNSLTYLGEQPPKILMGRTEIPKAVNASYINAAYESVEVCILSNKLQEVLREALASAGIKLVLNRTITDVQRQPSKYGLGKLKVVTDVGETHYDTVVNALWEGRATIDRKLGLNHRIENESYRVKANVRLANLKLHADIPSVSIMNGPFGDFVRYGPDDQVYFAWHPMSPKLITHNLSTAVKTFRGHVASDFPPQYEQDMIDGHRRAFEMIFPGYNSSFFDEGVVGTGYVVANGLTDIDDKESGLHTRNDPPNLVVDGYVSVKTQKLTNAPYNVYLLEKELFHKNDLARDK